MKNELLELYEIINKQNKIIEKVDVIFLAFQRIKFLKLGVYSGGIKSFNIPHKEKPTLPTRNKFK